MPSYRDIMVEVLEEERRREEHDSPMSPNGAAPWRVAEPLMVPEAVPFLIDALEGREAGARVAVWVLEAIGPAARAAAPVLERLGEPLALFRVDEARARELGVHKRADAWRTAWGTSARQEIARKMEGDRARAHFAALLDDPDVDVVRFAVDALPREPSGLYDRAWDDPSVVPVGSVLAALYHADHDVAKGAARLLMRLHRPQDAADVLSEWENTLVPPDVAWLAPLPASTKLYEHLGVQDVYELMRRRRCAGLAPPAGGWFEWFLADEPRDQAARAFAKRARGELRGECPAGSIEKGDERFALGHHEDWDPDAAAYGQYANVLMKDPKSAYAAFQLAWIDREHGSPITPERIAWLRSLGVTDEALLAELATPLTTILPGPRTRNKLVPGTKDALRAHLARVRAAITAPAPVPVPVPVIIPEPEPAPVPTPEPDLPIEVVRLKPPQRTAIGDYDVDQVAIEYAVGGDHLDFRLELGLGIDIFWALPADRGDRLRLVHVDAAAYIVDEPSLVADPFVGDLTLSWDGALAELRDGRALVSVCVALTSAPASYRCDLGIRFPDGQTRTTTFAWRAK